MPSSIRFGVERIIVACEFDNDVPASVRSSLCERVSGELKKRSAYPVVTADKAANPDPLSDLRMHVRASVDGADLVLAITPDHRAARSGVVMPAQTGRTALVAGTAPDLPALIGRILDKIQPPPASARKPRIPQPTKAN